MAKNFGAGVDNDGEAISQFGPGIEFLDNNVLPDVGSSPRSIDARSSYCNPDLENDMGGTLMGMFGGIGTSPGENDLWGATALESIYINGVQLTTSDGYSLSDDGYGKIFVGVDVNSAACENAESALYNGKERRVCHHCNGYQGQENSGSLPTDTLLGVMCHRWGLRFNFRRLDPETGEITRNGILNLDQFDPRGQAKHDGTIGNIGIKIVSQVQEGGSILVPESDRAVYETEPKEGEELDIYYEATHAIPMHLKKGNTLAFAPLKSKV